MLEKFPVFQFQVTGETRTRKPFLWIIAVSVAIPDLILIDIQSMTFVPNIPDRLQRVNGSWLE